MAPQPNVENVRRAGEVDVAARRTEGTAGRRPRPHACALIWRARRKAQTRVRTNINSAPTARARPHSNDVAATATPGARRTKVILIYVLYRNKMILTLSDPVLSTPKWLPSNVELDRQMADEPASVPRSRSLSSPVCYAHCSYSRQTNLFLSTILQ